MRSLIVEDSFINRSALSKLLVPFGEADIAVNGKEAIDAFVKAYENDTPYDIIFLDISMPEMDGHETLEEMRRYEQEIGVVGLDVVKVIMTTSERSSTHILGAFREGCEGYLLKPVEKESLYRLLLGMNAIPHKNQI